MVSAMVMVRGAKGIVAFSTVASVLMLSALFGVFGYVLQNMNGGLRHGTMQSFGRLSKCARYPCGTRRHAKPPQPSCETNHG